MADTLAVETRSRSRSKTPGILAAENGGSDKKGSKKIPTISLIEEENDVVEVQVSSTKSSQSQRSSTGRRKAKVISSETVTTTTVIETVKSTNGKEESSEQAASTTTMTKSSANDIAEPLESQSMFNNIFNAIKTSTPILSNKTKSRIVHDTKEVNAADHPAYKEYKEAGEYWNKYPKTDYTYSELSPHRREISNGVVAMPNMSRRSLEKYQYRVENMIQNNPLDETFLRKKFLTNSNSFAKRSAELQYDSTDEVDIAELRRTLQHRRKESGNVLTQFFMLITSYIYSGYVRTKQVFTRNNYQVNRSYSYYSSSQQQGIFRRCFESVKQFVLLGFSKVYLLLSSILCFDTWILYTRSDNAVENRKRKRFLLLLLILLPLLLAGGNYIYQDPPKNLSLPKITLPKINFPKITLPSMPKLSLPSISLPDFPKISFEWPQVSFEWLKFSRPEWLKLSRPEWLKFPDLTFTLPEFKVPTFNWPTISRPDWLRFPDISLPSFSWPEISLPSLPKFSLPSLPSFSFNISPYTQYVSDKFSSLKLSSIETFGGIKDAIVGLINEAQIVWNENFNAVVNSNTIETVVEPVVVIDAPFEPQQVV